MSVYGEALDKLLTDAGMLTVSERMAGQPIDGFFAHAQVVDLVSLYQWVEGERRSCMEQISRHDLGIHEIDDSELHGYILGKSGALAEFHINLRNVLRAMELV